MVAEGKTTRGLQSPKYFQENSANPQSRKVVSLTHGILFLF